MALLTVEANVGRSGGCRSTDAAESALVTTPVAIPCVIRAAKSHSTLEANRNISIPASWIASPARITGRRPTESDSDPVNSSATNRVIAYTANTAVSEIVEKWNFTA